jgi:hypothetical protein
MSEERRRRRTLGSRLMRAIHLIPIVVVGAAVTTDASTKPDTILGTRKATLKNQKLPWEDTLEKMFSSNIHDVPRSSLIAQVAEDDVENDESWRSKEDWWKDPLAMFDDDEEEKTVERKRSPPVQPPAPDPSYTRKDESLDDDDFLIMEEEEEEVDELQNLVLSPVEENLDIIPPVVEEPVEEKVDESIGPESPDTAKFASPNNPSSTEGDISTQTKTKAESSENTQQISESPIVTKESAPPTRASSTVKEPSEAAEAETTSYRFSTPDNLPSSEEDDVPPEWSRSSTPENITRKSHSVSVPFESLTPAKANRRREVANKALRIFSSRPSPPPEEEMTITPTLPPSVSVATASRGGVSAFGGVAALIPKLLGVPAAPVVQCLAVLVLGKAIVECVVAIRSRNKISEETAQTPPTAAHGVTSTELDFEDSLTYVENDFPLGKDAGVREDLGEEEDDILQDQSGAAMTSASRPTDSSKDGEELEVTADGGFRFPFWSRGKGKQRIPPARKLFDQVTDLRQQCESALQDKTNVEKEYETASWQLKDTQTELSSLKQTTRYLQAQLRDQEEMLERVVQTERRKAKDELARMKEAMVKVIKRERENMREEFLKQAAELQALWREERQQGSQTQSPQSDSEDGEIQNGEMQKQEI